MYYHGSVIPERSCDVTNSPWWISYGCFGKTKSPKRGNQPSTSSSEPVQDQIFTVQEAPKNVKRQKNEAWSEARWISAIIKDALHHLRCTLCQQEDQTPASKDHRSFPHGYITILSVSPYVWYNLDGFHIFRDLIYKWHKKARLKWTYIVEQNNVLLAQKKEGEEDPRFVAYWTKCNLLGAVRMDKISQRKDQGSITRTRFIWNPIL